MKFSTFLNIHYVESTRAHNRHASTISALNHASTLNKEHVEFKSMAYSTNGLITIIRYTEKILHSMFPMDNYKLHNTLPEFNGYRGKDLPRIYPLLRADVHIFCDHLCADVGTITTFNDVLFLLIASATGWRPSSLFGEHELKLYNVTFARIDGSLTMTIKANFEKREGTSTSLKRTFTAINSKYCPVRWTMTSLLLRQALNDYNGRPTVKPDRQMEPLFLGHLRKRSLKISHVECLLQRMCRHFNIPENSWTMRSFRKGYAFDLAFEIVNHDASPGSITMQNIIESLKSVANWDSDACEAYLESNSHSFRSVLEIFKVRFLRGESIKIEDCHLRASELGTTCELIKTDNPVMLALRKTHFISVGLKAFFAQFNSIIIKNAAVKLGKREEVKYEGTVLDTETMQKYYTWWNSKNWKGAMCRTCYTFVSETSLRHHENKGCNLQRSNTVAFHWKLQQPVEEER